VTLQPAQKIASGLSGDPVPFSMRSGSSREQKLETIKPPRLLDRSLEIEIIEDVYAHRDQRQAMQRIWDRRRQTRRHDVVWPVASDEGNAPLFQEIRNVGVISGEAGFPRPGTERARRF
jgi:hypothetical protein